MTELAYLADMPSAYVRSFRARVAALPPGAVVLDRTYFYPTGGGHPNDCGTLSTEGGPSFEVVDVTRSGPSVLHRTRGVAPAGRALTVGAEVEGRIDWVRRHRHMRLHTAQHLLSARVFLDTGRRTRKANLRGLSATIDLDGALTDGEVAAVGETMRVALERPQPVSIRTVARAAWDRHPASERSGWVPLPPHVDPVRVVEIAEHDVCPCGGTHVRSTGEIGPVVLRSEPRPGDGSVRLAVTLVEPDRPTPPA